MNTQPPELPHYLEHVDGGTRREPQPGETYLNEHALTQGRITEMFSGPNGKIYLDPEIPYKERWIIRIR